MTCTIKDVKIDSLCAVNALRARLNIEKGNLAAARRNVAVSEALVEQAQLAVTVAEDLHKRIMALPDDAVEEPTVVGGPKETP